MFSDPGFFKGYVDMVLMVSPNFFLRFLGTMEVLGKFGVVVRGIHIKVVSQFVSFGSCSTRVAGSLGRLDYNG